MHRSYQIRIVDDYGDEEIECFENSEEAQIRWIELRVEKQNHPLDNCFEMELLEVLDQATITSEEVPSR